MHLKKCSGCARAIVESATACDYCGHQAAVPVESVPDVVEIQDEGSPRFEDLYDEELPPLDVAMDTSTEQPSAPVAEAHVPPPVAKRFGKRELMTGTIGIVGGGLLILMMTSSRGVASREEPVVQPQPPAARKAANAPGAIAPLPGSTPRWTSNPTWVGQERRAAAFEVAATSKAQVWMRRVQPMLVVRCRANNLEAFVFTDSAAKMEPEDQDHTVSVQFDGEPAVSERWADSSEHDALFARDGRKFVRQLLAASTLHFSYSPHNADPVVATFNVAGLQEHLSAAAKSCGIKATR